MNLQDAISHCKTMMTQNNGGNFTIITEEDEVIEGGFGQSNVRTFSKFDVWWGPHGEQQIWGVLVIDSSGSTLSAAMWGGGGFRMTPTANKDEIGIIFMDRMGGCRAVTAKAVDASWRRVEKPDIFWTNQWAKGIHDISNGISGVRPSSMHTQYGDYQVGDEVGIAEKGSSYGARGKVLSFLSYKNSYGGYGEPLVLIGDLNSKGLFHKIEFKNIFLSQSPKTAVDKQEEKEDTEADMLMKFFASSQHDPSSPWFNKSNNERK